MDGGGESLIEVNLRDVHQLFETLDPVPFRERDLSRDAEAFIVDSARELPEDRPLRLVVHLPRTAESDPGVAGLGAAVGGYFRYRADVTRRDLRELFGLGRRAFLVGCGILAGCLVLSQALAALLPDRSIVRFVEEGLVIVGWVALWRPLEIFLYDWWPLARDRKLFLRLAEMPVGVRFVGEDAPGV